MTYSDKFAHFGLPDTTPDNYETAEQYAKQFKRCTVLSYDNVSYSSTTNLNNKNKTQYKSDKHLTTSD